MRGVPKTGFTLPTVSLPLMWSNKQTLGNRCWGLLKAQLDEDQPLLRWSPANTQTTTSLSGKTKPKKNPKENPRTATSSNMNLYMTFQRKWCPSWPKAFSWTNVTKPMFTPNELEKTQDIPNEADAVCQGPAVHTVGLVLEDDLLHISSQQDHQNLGEQFVVCAEDNRCQFLMSWRFFGSRAMMALLQDTGRVPEARLSL